MFFWLVIIFFVLGGLVYWQSVRAEKKAYSERLKVIRKKIEDNDRKKFLEQLENNDAKN
ncbi:MAG: hypothetical protein OQJ89_07840 [Kangiellaceae bacterium]|nr:hypothetical protein [Kangiellaceae bacterium]MCW8998501.1 hypothetical protein [Kangiellaceae bacterium]MCW9016857.1 hypothetical protein [Kangiellaceae bacterium]